jgi:3-methyladenine DNA glycosylase/8-oxoguanine DNA glycosylase
MRVSAHEVARATRTSDGPATLHLQLDGERLVARAWGLGAERALEDLPDLIGENEETSDIATDHPVVRELSKRCRGLRIGRTSAVIEALVPAVLEQKITGAEARRVFRSLVAEFGEPAPGPLDLHLHPSPSTLASTPYWSFHRIGLERRRAEEIVNACRHSARLEATCALPHADGYRILRAIPGIGPWTAAEIGARAYGDPDAIPIGDFHLPHMVAWVLAGEPRANDDRMLELLAPFAGQRGRVLRMIEARAARRPRIAPRATTRRIATY